jgi:hypothetical protein
VVAPASTKLRSYCPSGMPVMRIQERVIFCVTVVRSVDITRDYESCADRVSLRTTGHHHLCFIAFESLVRDVIERRGCVEIDDKGLPVFVDLKRRWWDRRMLLKQR